MPFFPREQIVLKPEEHSFMKIETPFVNESSGLVIVKMLDKKSQSTVMLKLKII